MASNVYEGIVVRTTRKPIATGCTECIEVPEIIFLSDAPFVAPNDESAKLAVFAAAQKSHPDLSVSDPGVVVEVRVRKFL